MTTVPAIATVLGKDYSKTMNAISDDTNMTPVNWRLPSKTQLAPPLISYKSENVDRNYSDRPTDTFAGISFDFMLKVIITSSITNIVR